MTQFVKRDIETLDTKIDIPDRWAATDGKVSRRNGRGRGRGCGRGDGDGRRGKMSRMLGQDPWIMHAGAWPQKQRPKRIAGKH